MLYPDWTPAPIIELLDEYQTALEANQILDPNVRQEIVHRHDIWARLAVRPEMEDIWSFISGLGETMPLLSNGGLCGTIDRALDSYKSNPLLTKNEYKLEMLEISKMASALSNKLKKFCDAEYVRNPFKFGALLDQDFQLRAAQMIRPELLEGGRFENDSFNTLYALDHHLPPIYLQLTELSRHAKIESTEQLYKLKIPKKTNDKNAFRTYFIRTVADYFFFNYADYSPTRISTFCSVALDDPSITSDLVRKNAPLDDDCKAFLKAQHAYSKKEH